MGYNDVLAPNKRLHGLATLEKPGILPQGARLDTQSNGYLQAVPRILFFYMSKKLVYFVERLSVGAQFQEAEMKEQLMQADVLSQQGKWAEAVNLLCTLNQGQPDIGIERKLVDIRLQAHTAQQWLAPIAPWAGEWENYPANGHGIDEIESAAFNALSLIHI